MYNYIININIQKMLKPDFYTPTTPGVSTINAQCEIVRTIILNKICKRKKIKMFIFIRKNTICKLKTYHHLGTITL